MSNPTQKYYDLINEQYNWDIFNKDEIKTIENDLKDMCDHCYKMKMSLLQLARSHYKTMDDYKWMCIKYGIDNYDHPTIIR